MEGNVLFFIVVVIVALLLVIVRTIYSTFFPNSIANELEAAGELLELRASANRQNIINVLMKETIAKLNVQTCVLDGGGQANFCDSGLQEGLSSLLKSLLNSLGDILEQYTVKFTVGFYINQYEGLSKPGDEMETGILIVRDDLKKWGDTIVKELIDKDVSQESLAIKSAILTSWKDSDLVHRTFESGNDNLSIICAPLPWPCESDTSLGAMFIITSPIEKLPVDTSVCLAIFNIIAANFISKYNDCVSHRKTELAGRKKGKAAQTLTARRRLAIVRQLCIYHQAHLRKPS